jgi:hypothetical protein
MKRHVLYIIAIAIYLFLLGGLISSIVLIDEESTRLFTMYALSSALMVSTLIVAILAMNINAEENMIKDYEERFRKE